MLTLGRKRHNKRALKRNETVALRGNDSLLKKNLRFNYVETRWCQMKPLTTFSGASFSEGLWCESATGRRRGREAGPILPWEQSSGNPPPVPRHPPLTLSWHTLVSKPSLRLPSAGKPARIRKFHLSQFILKTTFKSQAGRCVRVWNTESRRLKQSRGGGTGEPTTKCGALNGWTCTRLFYCLPARGSRLSSAGFIF